MDTRKMGRLCYLSPGFVSDARVGSAQDELEQRIKEIMKEFSQEGWYGQKTSDADLSSRAA